MTALFVAGAHTDVGKTFAACAMLRAARAKGLATDAFKPVVSGFDPQDWAESDPGRLLQALGRELTFQTLDAVSPWRYRAPLSPPMAARLEGQQLALSDFAGFCREGLARSRVGFKLVEGVGGVMSPIAAGATCLDLMGELGLPVVLVGGGYLGAISHTLTACEVVRARGLRLQAVVVSEDADPQAPSFADTVASVAEFTRDVPVLAAARDDQAWAAALV